MQIYIYIFCNVRFVSFDITFFALKKICEYTYTHTHTRVTPLSSYLILATLTKAKCTLIGNYWTSVFFERKKILALTSTFLHPFTSSLSLSRTFISIAILVSQFFTGITHRPIVITLKFIIGGGVNRLERDQS